jgi:hypothetical protein
MGLMATVVDTAALGKVIAASLIAGIGLTMIYSLAILGTARFADMRRAGRPVEAGLFALLGAAALFACVVAIVVGIVIMTQK